MVEDAICVEGNLILAFEENFEDTCIDTRVWQYTQPWGNHSEKGTLYSLEYFTDGLNYGFDKHNLDLIAKEERFYAKAVPYKDSSYMLMDGLPNLRWWQYTSGMIYSQQSFGYGKYEIRCKVPKGKGFWSVFMLFGQDNHEIDVMEFWNEHNLFGKYSQKRLATECHMTMHANGRSCPSHYKEDDFSDEFHTYTLIWNSNKIEWFVDGTLRRESYRFYTAMGQPTECSAVRKGNYYLIDHAYPYHQMHMAVGLSLQAGKNSPDENTPFPARLSIDYIKYWRYADR